MTLPLMTPDEQVDFKLAQYDESAMSYKESLAAVLMELKRRLSEEPTIRVHQVISRVKDRESLERKMRARPGRDVEDILGVRIITYFRDDADWVERVVRDMMIVRPGTRSDKSEGLGDAEFGYRSIQFVATVPSDGPGEVDPDNLRNMIWVPPMSPGIVEFQIRTVLEHAWAEIEHDVYKAAEKPPRDIRRKFGRSAALLEVADEQLSDIRNALMLDRPKIIAVDGDESGFVQRIIESDRASKELDSYIQHALDLPFGDPLKGFGEVNNAVFYSPVRGGEQLRAALAEYHRLGLQMAIVCTDPTSSLTIPDAQPDEDPTVFRGIGAYWICMALHAMDTDEFRNITSRVQLGRLDEFRQVAKYLITNPGVSALATRDQYWPQRYETGKVRQPHPINLTVSVGRRHR